MSEKPISPLRRRMIEDMSVRNFVEKTRNDYIGCEDCAAVRRLSAAHRGDSVPWYARQVSLPGS